MKRILFILLSLGLMGAAQAGNIMMTGHDVLLHSGQRGHDAAALDYLRDGTAKADYSIAVVGGGSGFARFTGGVDATAGGHNSVVTNSGSTLAGYGPVKYWHAQSATAAEWTEILSADVLVVLSHTSCGGCDSNNASVAALNAQSGAIATAFNAGMDIWALSGASNADFYNFLPPGVAAAGSSIGGSSGFTCTADGLAVFGASGCAASGSMINGFPTHNRFTGFDPDFTVFEVRGDEDITIGLKGGIIDDGGIGVPEPGTLMLLSLGLLGLGGATARRRR